MASLKYYLDAPLKNRTGRALYLRYKTATGSTSFYPGLDTVLAKWDGKAQRLRGTSLDVHKLNQQLVDFRKSVYDAVEALRQQTPNLADPLPTLVKARVSRGNASLATSDVLTLGSLPDLVRRAALLREGELRKSSRTQYSYTANCLEHFCPADDARWTLGQLTAAHLETWRQWMVRPRDSGGLGTDNQTANNRLAVVGASLTYFRTHDRAYRLLLDEELVLITSRKFKVVKHIRTHLTQDELLSFYHAELPPESRGSEYLVRDIYCLSWLTSLRQSDLFELSPHHILWDGSDPATRRPVALDTTSIKSLTTTRLPLNKLAGDILCWWLDRERPELAPGTKLQHELARFKWPQDRIFPLVSRRRHAVIKLLWERLGLFPELVEVVKAKGAHQSRTLVPRRELLTLHTARHGFGNFMAASNVPIEDASLLMGHANIETTKIYYHRPEQQAFDRASLALASLNPVHMPDPDLD